MFYVIEAGRHLFRAEMASDPKMIGEVQFDLDQYLRNYPLGIPAEEVKLAVSEGLSNAIVHGNRNNRIMHVVLLLVAEAGAVTLRFEDCGNGFDWRNLPATHPEAPKGATTHKEGGLARLARLGYTCHFNEDGTVLTLRKPLPPRESPSASSQTEKPLASG